MTGSSPASPRRVTRWVPWVLCLVVLVVALAVGTARDHGPLTAQDRVTGIARTIKCPTCQGESVAESNAGPSKEIRRDIAERIQQGQSDDQIRAYYGDRYGPEILLTPPRTGVASLVWILPVVVLILAAAGLVWAFRRWGERPQVSATDADRALVDEALHDLEVPDGGR